MNHETDCLMDTLKKRFANRRGMFETGLDESSFRSEEQKCDQEKYMSDAMFACNGLKPRRYASSAPSA